MYRVLMACSEEVFAAVSPIVLRSADRGLLPLAVVIGVGLVLLGIGVVAWWHSQWDSTTDSPTDDPKSAIEPPRSERPVLTDEERIIHLLRSNGGRMRQTRIVEETDWSKAKVSMRLSEMEADGTISKLRVGRENIVSLPGAEPTPHSSMARE